MMRTDKEILELMLEHKDLLQSGLCSFALKLNNIKYINLEELSLIMDYIKTNRPNKFSSIDAFLHRDSGYYWHRGRKSPRIKWIKQHIKKLS